MHWLDEEVFGYSGTDAYPFHMPGAKRKNPGLSGDLFRYDITEIGGFDDLRDAKGLLADLENEWARMYGAGRAFLSVNGSTGSNLAVIFAATKEYDKAIIAEGAHWSVYNAAKLRHLEVVELPLLKDGSGIAQAVSAEAVDKLLEENEDARVVIITTPSYEGVVSDVESIARVVHARGAVLVVDAAHGAHFGLRGVEGAFPFENPVRLGADAAVTSLHKTLPVLGQTSLILFPQRPLCIVPSAVKSYLNMFQTSSPSYLLMSAAAAGCRFLQREGERAGEELRRNLAEFYAAGADLKRLHILDSDNHDRSKIIITTKNAGISGTELMQLLRERYRLELEKAGAYYALALSTVMDTAEGFRRLSTALCEIDAAF